MRDRDFWWVMSILLLVIITFIYLAMLPNTKNVTSEKVQKADYYYKLDTWAANIEVYEFTPQSNSNKTCIMLSESSDLECFDKQTNEQETK